MTLIMRSSVRVLLVNSKNELLLMCANDPTTTNVDGKYHGKFWFLVGGEIESNETIQKAAIREIYEETGIKEDQIILGSVVWYGEVDLFLKGNLTRLKETFIVANTNQEKVSFNKLDEWEKKVVEKLEWFSLEKIKNSKEVIYPVVLSEYLPDILVGIYPDKPLEIDLAKQPN